LSGIGTANSFMPFNFTWQAVSYWSKSTCKFIIFSISVPFKYILASWCWAVDKLIIILLKIWLKLEFNKLVIFISIAEISKV
jgi:hypothetical protein